MNVKIISQNLVFFQSKGSLNTGVEGSFNGFWPKELTF